MTSQRVMQPDSERATERVNPTCCVTNEPEGV